MIFILLLVSLVQAAQVSVEIKQRELVVGQTTSFTVKVFDGSPRGLPSVPAGAGLLVRFESQSQQHIVSNFKSTRIVQFNYQLSATQPGNWHLGPVDLVVDGQRLGAAPVTIRVGKAPADQGAAPLIATLSDSAPFLGEVVVYRLQFKRSRPVLSVEWTPPGFDGFIQEKVAEQAQREYTITEGGQQYMVQTIEVPLVAAALGSHTVPPAVLTARYRAQPRARTRAQRPSFDDLFRDSPLRSRGSERKTHSTVPLPTEIRPLPDEGRPVDFGGLVGRFKVSTEASALKVRLGESVTLTTTLEGAGTLHGFRPVAVIKRAIVPEAEGMLTVSGLEIPVFDPKMEKYTILQTRPVVIEVQPGEEGAGQVSSFMDGKGDARRDVESLGEDILPVSMPDRMEDMTLAGALPIITALPGLPLLIWLALVANAWLDGRRVDPMVVQRRRLADLPTGPSERLAVLEDVFREVAGIRLGVPAPGLDADAVADLGEEAAEIYRQLERARYGGAGAGLDALAARIRRFMGVK